jgi:aminoglycoside 6'-N-acetyltransferase I
MMPMLWPSAGTYDFGHERVLVWERDDGGLAGFIALSRRPRAEGCESTPVPYLEGWWVARDLRGAAVGPTVVAAAAEDWCGERGDEELGSDVEIDDAIRPRAHTALGVEPTLRLQFFRKPLC